MEQSLIEAVGLEWAGGEGSPASAAALSHIAIRNHALLTQRMESDLAASRSSYSLTSPSGEFASEAFTPHHTMPYYTISYHTITITITKDRLPCNNSIAVTCSDWTTCASGIAHNLSLYFIVRCQPLLQTLCSAKSSFSCLADWTPC